MIVIYKIKLTFNGVTKTLSEWSKITGIKHSTLYDRYKKGLSVYEILYNDLDYHKHKHENNAYKHGYTGTRLYRIYTNMKTRCYNPNSPRRKNYYDKGIIICDEWLKDKTKFFEWALNNGYADNLTIDRIDNNGNYEPNNCRWVNYKEQANNTSTSVKLYCDDKWDTLNHWAKLYNIDRRTIMNRIYLLGYDVEDAIKAPKDHRREKLIENSFRKHLIDIGVYPIGLVKQKKKTKQIGYNMKVFNGGFIGVTKGIPDLYICINGCELRLEVKQENGRLSVHQKRIICEMIRCGCRAYVLDPITFEMCIKLVDNMAIGDTDAINEVSDTLKEYTLSLIDEDIKNNYFYI